jgi:hypothetical protein
VDRVEIVAARPTGWRIVAPVAASAFAVVFSALAIVHGSIYVWSLAPGAVGVATIFDRVCSLRPSSIVAEQGVVTVRSHLGFTDRRGRDNLLTIEWHDQGWRRSIVLNFANFADNIRVSAQGYSRQGIEHFAATVGKDFLDESRSDESVTH